jgi:hypothetical protein
MSLSLKSNWDEYYSNERYAVPDFIVNALWSRYEFVIARHIAGRSNLVVVELGGADSCFYQPFTQRFSVSEYHVVDNNRVGLESFRDKSNSTVRIHEADLLCTSRGSLPISADIVYSAGLIEHFVPTDTERIVRTHFDLCRPGGLVLMSFPTPTMIYSCFRWLLERLDRFPPVFERPIGRGEIEPLLAPTGELLEHEVIWKTLLTQRLVLCRKITEGAI